MLENDATIFERDFRFWAVIVGLAITTLLAALEHTVVTTSAPAIVSDLRMEENYIWITNSFFVSRCVMCSPPSLTVPKLSKALPSSLSWASYVMCSAADGSSLVSWPSLP